MSEDYLRLHADACVVDLHIHPALKLSLFHRNLSDKHKLGLFARASWPFATRTDFPKMMAGGLDVGLSVIYIPEAGWFDDIPILSLAK